MEAVTGAVRTVRPGHVFDKDLHMTSHCFEYKGHAVIVVVEGDENEQWGWSYSIDSGAPTPSRTHTLPGPVEAVEKATRHVKRRIDALP
jgi:hypothetical protein